jgi:lipopolysaccharide/colanic/teichoic acid biosynthesis glycosyltransferase
VRFQERVKKQGIPIRTAALKIMLDWFLALLLLPVAVPLILLSALLVKLTSAGPAFYTQARVGRHGRPFTIYKIRTMIDDCESLTGPRWSMPGDPRVTLVGHVLRVTHLDELPQLLNVFKGDMSLIGPRPERPEFVNELEQALPRYHERLAVRPGITGLAQVLLPPDTELESVKSKLKYDLLYVDRINFWLDIRILICTALRVLGLPVRLIKAVLMAPQGELPAIGGRTPKERPAPAVRVLPARPYDLGPKNAAA